MSTLLPTAPQLPVSTFIVEMAGIRYAVTLTWQPRLFGWYIDLALEDGTVIVNGRRLNPGTGPYFGIVKEALPGVALVVIGPSDYNQLDLGDALQVVLLTVDEMVALADGVISTQPTVTGVTA